MITILVNNNCLVVFSRSIMKKYHFYHIKSLLHIPNFVILHHFSRHPPFFLPLLFWKMRIFFFTQITLLSEYSQQSCLSDATKSKGSSNIVLSLEWIFSWNCRIVWCDYMLVLCLSSPKAYYYLKKMAGKQWYVMNDALLRWGP